MTKYGGVCRKMTYRIDYKRKGNDYMKKNSAKKKLIPAACMLAVSAAMLATSTYAWFTMNKEVTVTGLNLQARGEGGIVIARTASNNEDRSTNLTTSSAKSPTDVTLFPTSTSDADIWYHASAESVNASKADYSTIIQLNSQSETGNVYAKTNSTNDTMGTIKVGNKQYVLFDNFTVYPDNNADKYTDLFVSSCSVSSTEKTISRSMRVAVVAGIDTDRKVVICAPVNGATTSYKIGGTTSSEDGVTQVYALDTSGTDKIEKTASTSNAAGNVLKEGEVDENGLDVSVYLYFEGEDSNHTTANLNSDNGAESLAVTLTLACSDVTAKSTN